jgi:protein-tyrosine-phosphatase
MQVTKHRKDIKMVGTHTHTNTHTHTHAPKPIRENESVIVIWNQRVSTNTEATANRPDLIIKIEEEKACILIGVAMPANRNVNKMVQKIF